MIPATMAPDRPESRPQLLLVCSTGGHLLQLVALREAWGDFTRVWVTFDRGDSRSLLADEEVVLAYSPTNRNAKNLVLNLVLAFRLIQRSRPQAVVTTGAGVAVPFAWIARLFGAKVVYVESVTRIDSPSLSCRLIRPVASRMYVQWPELLEALPPARYRGSVLDG
jgi:beta-1,4-N-acetylglucosaminyltransferase